MKKILLILLILNGVIFLPKAFAFQLINNTNRTIDYKVAIFGRGFRCDIGKIEPLGKRNISFCKTDFVDVGVQGLYAVYDINKIDSCIVEIPANAFETDLRLHISPECR